MQYHEIEKRDDERLLTKRDKASITLTRKVSYGRRQRRLKDKDSSSIYSRCNNNNEIRDLKTNVS